jgi:hypothetical protein
MVNGRRKGNNHENTVARLLSIALYLDDTYTRWRDAPISQLPVRRRKTSETPADDWRGAGDLMFSSTALHTYHPRGHKTPPLSVEAKSIKGVNGLHVFTFAPKVAKMYAQAERQAKRSKDVPVLAVRIAGEGVAFIFPNDYGEFALRAEQLYRAFRTAFEACATFAEVEDVKATAKRDCYTSRHVVFVPLSVLSDR